MKNNDLQRLLEIKKTIRCTKNLAYCGEIFCLIQVVFMKYYHSVCGFFLKKNLIAEKVWQLYEQKIKKNWNYGVD